MGAIGGLFLIVLALGVYFLPTIVAAFRYKKNTAAIFALNFFLGWTLLGWVLSFVWALTVEQPTALVLTQGAVPLPPAEE